MTQTDRDGNRILLALLAELEVFGEIVVQTPPANHVGLWNLQHTGIPYQPARWFNGPLNPTRRKAYSRATHRLERRGLVTCIRRGRRHRVAALRLTPTGLRQALELVDGSHQDAVPPNVTPRKPPKPTFPVNGPPTVELRMISPLLHSVFPISSEYDTPLE